MTLKRAIVTSVGPLRIMIDGDTEPIPFTPKSGIDPATLAVGDVVHADQSGHRLVVLVRVGGLGLLSGRNLIINGNFRTNQRGVTSLTTGSGYLFDRWKRGETTTWYEWTTAPQGQPLTVGTSDYIRHLFQIIERASVPAGTYTLSWEGTATGRVYNSGGSAPSYTSGPITVALDGLEDVVVSFEGQGDTLGKIKLEAGTVPTPFEQISVADELALCQRYYWQVGPSSALQPFINGAIWSTTNAYLMMPLRVTMRARPTLTYSGASDFKVWSRGSYRTASTVTLNNASTELAELKMTASSIGDAGDACYVRIDPDGWLAFDAEL